MSVHRSIILFARSPKYLQLGLRGIRSQLRELHSQGHVASQLQLALHKSRLTVESSAHHINKVVLLHHNSAISRVGGSTFLDGSRGVLQIDNPDLTVNVELVDAVNLLNESRVALNVLSQLNVRNRVLVWKYNKESVEHCSLFKDAPRQKQ